MADAAEDVFDETGDQLQLEQKAWQKVQRKLQTDGFREGHSAGEENNLQEHFDAGYAAGLARVWPIAQLRGRLCAAIAACHLRGEPAERTDPAGGQVALLTELEQQLGAGRGRHDSDPAQTERTLRTAEEALRSLLRPGPAPPARQRP